MNLKRKNEIQETMEAIGKFKEAFTIKKIQKDYSSVFKNKVELKYRQ